MNTRAKSGDNGGRRPENRHAVVLGGSLAGLLAARVLSDHFEHVTLIERDVYPETPETRRGIPQAHHVHGLRSEEHTSELQSQSNLVRRLVREKNKPCR